MLEHQHTILIYPKSFQSVDKLKNMPPQKLLAQLALGRVDPRNHIEIFSLGLSVQEIWPRLSESRHGASSKFYL